MPDSWRIRGAGYLHTGYYFGFVFAALANFTIGTHFGWRAMFLFGGLPALLLAWLRRGVTEPERWLQKEKIVHAWSWWRPLAALFTPAFRRAVASGKPAVIELRMNPDQITTRATIADLRSGKPPPPDAQSA